MSSISLLLFQVHDRVHDFQMKLNYSEPKLYTGGIKPSNWKHLTSKEKNEALSKKWYLYYSFRNPKTGKLERQPNIKAGINSLAKFQDRIKELKTLKKALNIILESGYNPFKEETLEVIQNRLNESKIDIQPALQSKLKPTIQPTLKTTLQPTEKSGYTISEAKELVLNTKNKILTKNSFSDFRSIINALEKWLIDNKVDLNSDISSLNKKLIVKFLNRILEKTSARTRNNYRAILSSFFQVIVDTENCGEILIKPCSINSVYIYHSISKAAPSYQTKSLLTEIKIEDNISYYQDYLGNLKYEYEFKNDSIFISGIGPFIKTSNKTPKIYIQGNGKHVPISKQVNSFRINYY